MATRRRQARIVVMQTLFEIEGRERDAQEVLHRNIAEVKGQEVDVGFAEELLFGVLQRSQEVREIIQHHAPQWPWERMDGIARSLLLLGTFEIAFRQDAPPAVVMDEAIEIAKEYGTSESAKFVNGVLNAIAHAKD